jgi:hypothetical protein
MNIQESAIWTKYIYIVPKERRIPREKFHELYEEYTKHPERKEKLLRKLRALSIEQGKINARKNKLTIKNQPASKSKGNSKSKSAGKSKSNGKPRGSK